MVLASGCNPLPETARRSNRPLSHIEGPILIHSNVNKTILRMGITNGIVSCKVKQKDQIPQGWYRGRNTKNVPVAQW